MPTIHLHQTTTATPEQFVAALTDFGPGRSKIFGNSADSYLKVHSEGADQADVTEGSSNIWERLHYDWSDPDRVVLTTTDSNVWGGASGHTYTFARRPDGTTDVDVVVVRDARTSRGGWSGWWSGSSGSASWASSWTRPSRRSKPATPGRPRRIPRSVARRHSDVLTGTRPTRDVRSRHEPQGRHHDHDRCPG